MDNGCTKLILELYRRDCREISKQCVEEGYPSYGSNYDLRISCLWDEEYDSWYCEALSYTDTCK